MHSASRKERTNLVVFDMASPSSFLACFLRCLASAYFLLGGYFLLPTSTLGSQVHHSSSLMLSMTLGIWLPQPYQVALSSRHI